jgi:hypothetical protein
MRARLRAAFWATPPSGWLSARAQHGHGFGAVYLSQRVGGGARDFGRRVVQQPVSSATLCGSAIPLRATVARLRTAGFSERAACAR